MTALFAMKNLTNLWPVNHDPFVACYVDHNNDLGDRPQVPTTTPKRITVNDLPFGSFHKGGANFCFGDGAVHYLVDNIDSAVYLAVGSRNGDEVTSDSY
jgi:prepilin-type processing-associated H-X9-DG protein